MDAEVERLAQSIIAAYNDIPAERRLLVAVAGPPGSGKSTLAYPLTSHLNAQLTHRPEKTTITDETTGLTFPPPGSAINGNTPAEGDEVAVCVGLDGWHYSRAELDGFADPAEAHWRRGAAFTFNLPSYLSFLQLLRLPLIPEPPKAIPFPTFDHGIKDPQLSPLPILPRHRVIIIEGLYTLLDRPGWRECAGIMDMRVWVEADRDICRQRLIRRNWAAGIADDLKECEARVDASDMANGEQVRNYRYSPTDIVMPANR